MNGLLPRREFVRTTTGAALAMAVAPRAWRRRLGGDPLGPMVLRDPRVKALAMQALDAARSAGAQYADVRLTYTINSNGGIQFIYVPDTDDPWETLGVGVRALVDGCWGWASRPDLSVDAGVWAGREAVRLAKASAVGGLTHRVEWGTVPPVPNGEWTTPIDIDPFEIALDELFDWRDGWMSHADDLGVSGTAKFDFQKQERVFASTEGSYITQTLYQLGHEFKITYRGRDSILRNGEVAAGWEYIVKVPWDDLIRQEKERIDAAIAHPLPVKSFEIGSYDVAFSADTMAQLLGYTLGSATQLDVALGYQVAAGVSSYLGPDPLTFLGTAVASPLVTVTADRSRPQGMATVKWDEEGVVPEDFTLIKDGVLVDYQTTREQAAWLAPWYARQGQAIRSHGCAAAPDAGYMAMQHMPNLTLHPGQADLSLEDLVAGMDTGLVMETPESSVDWQSRNGTIKAKGQPHGMLAVWEVRRGKRVAQYEFGEYRTVAYPRSPKSKPWPWVRFSTSVFWKNVVALGGPKSVVQGGGSSAKGIGSVLAGDGDDPWEEDGVSADQSVSCSISAVPALITRLAVADLREP
jgi:TldD protein